MCFVTIFASPFDRLRASGKNPAKTVYLLFYHPGLHPGLLMFHLNESKLFLVTFFNCFKLHSF